MPAGGQAGPGRDGDRERRMMAQRRLDEVGAGRHAEDVGGGHPARSGDGGDVPGREAVRRRQGQRVCRAEEGGRAGPVAEQGEQPRVTGARPFDQYTFIHQIGRKDRRIWPILYLYTPNKFPYPAGNGYICGGLLYIKARFFFIISVSVYQCTDAPIQRSRRGKRCRCPSPASRDRARSFI